MKVSSYHAVLIAAAAFSAQASRDYGIHPGETTSVADAGHVHFVKQWTLTAGTNAKAISALDLSLAGNAYVSYVSDLPTDVLGYVNVSGSSKAVVNGVVLSRDIDEERDFGDVGNAIDNIVNLDILDDHDDEDRGLFFDSERELSIRLRKSVTSGYLLTEVFLAVPDAVSEFSSRLSAQVVIEDRVLLRKNKLSSVEIEASDISAVFVSAPDTDVILRDLELKASEDASITYNVSSLSTMVKVDLETNGFSNILLSASSIKTNHIDFEAGSDTSQICVNSRKVLAITHYTQGDEHISLPNSRHKYGTEGDFSCERTRLPRRVAGKIVGVASETKKNEDSDDDDLFNFDLDDDSEDR